MFIKPRKLSAGDRVATISLSGGSAGEADMHWRYEIAKHRLHDLFGLEAVETPNSQRGRRFIYENPRARADDLAAALEDPSVRAVFLNQGGDDGIRIMPYVDLGAIRRNPKIFMGYSDGSTFTSMFQKAGVVSFYGPDVLTSLSEPVRLHDYTAKWIRKVLFRDEIIGPVDPADSWTAEPRVWSSAVEAARKMTPNRGYEILQGTGTVSGILRGGCTGPMQQMKSTKLWPELQEWEDSIIFLEGLTPYGLELAGLHMLRSFAATGMFRKARGVVFAKPSELYDESKRIILKVLRDEEGLHDLPILFNIDCGHTAPMAVMPFGVMAEIDCDNVAFSILESAVV